MFVYGNRDTCQTRCDSYNATPSDRDWCGRPQKPCYDLAVVRKVARGYTVGFEKRTAP